jgi:O-antigen/teichoic acid export membrane protein
VIEIVELLAGVMIVVVGVPMFVDSITRIYFDYSDAEDRRRVISTGLMFTILLSSILILAGAVGGRLASQTLFHTADYASLIAWTFTSVLLSNVSEVGLAYQRIRRRAAFVAVYSCAQFALAAGLNIYFLAFAKKGIWGFVLSKFISLGVGAAVILVRTIRETGFGFSLECAKRMVRFGRSLILTSVGFFLINFSDRGFLNHFRTTADVGIYALAYKFGFIISYLVGNPFKSVWEVNVFEDMQSPLWKHQAADMARVLFLSLAGVALSLSVFATPIIRMVAAPAYASAAGLIPILTFAYALREVGDFFGSILFINKRMVRYASAVLLSAGFNLALEWLLIRSWGATGAAWATFLTWVAYTAGCWIMAQREHHLPLEKRGFALLAVICVLATSAAAGLGNFALVPDLALRVLVMIVAGVFVWKSRCISPDQHAEIQKRLRLSLGALRSVLVGNG